MCSIHIFSIYPSGNPIRHMSGALTGYRICYTHTALSVGSCAIGELLRFPNHIALDPNLSAICPSSTIIELLAITRITTSNLRHFNPSRSVRCRASSHYWAANVHATSKIRSTRISASIWIGLRKLIVIAYSRSVDLLLKLLQTFPNQKLG